MKEYKRLATGIELGNSPDGTTIVLNVVDFDGGVFDLHPRIDGDDLVLVDPRRPNSYGVRITGQPDALGRLGKALQTVSRNASKADDAKGDDEEE